MSRFIFILLLGLGVGGCVEREFGVGEMEAPMRGEDLVTREERRNGSLALPGATVIVVENGHGAVVVEGNGRAGELRWFTHTLTRGRSAAEAQARQDSIGMQVSFDADTFFVTLAAPAHTVPVLYSGLLSLSVPPTLPVVVTALTLADVSDLRAELAVRADAVTLRRHTGDLDLATIHDASLELALRPGGRVVAVSDSGEVALSLPTDTDATLEAQAPNGSIITNNLPFVSQQRQPGKLTGTLGTGNGTIRLTARRANVRLTGF